MITQEAGTLKERYDSIKANNPRLRIKDYADLMGITELELLASNLHDEATKLDVSPVDIYQKMPNLGKIMVLARNESAVHERKGTFSKVQVHGSAGLIVGPDIDLRVLFSDWQYVYNVEKEHNGKTLRSIQYFNKYGKAAQKVYLTDSSNLEEYNKLIAEYKSDDNSIPEVEKGQKTKNYATPKDIDYDAAIAEWQGLADTHNFQSILNKQKIKRLDLVKKAPEELAYRVNNDAVLDMLYAARDRQVPIMAFVENDDIVQIHTGEITNIKLIENWTNILDEEFNLHFRNDMVSETWVLFKPTADGTVTSLELYDMEGELMLTFFGKRKPGIPELQSWRDIISEIEKAK